MILNFAAANGGGHGTATAPLRFALVFVFSRNLYFKLCAANGGASVPLGATLHFSTNPLRCPYQSASLCPTILYYPPFIIKLGPRVPCAPSSVLTNPLRCPYQSASFCLTNMKFPFDPLFFQLQGTNNNPLRCPYQSAGLCGADW